MDFTLYKIKLLLLLLIIIEHYTFVTLFSRKSDTPPPPSALRNTLMAPKECYEYVYFQNCCHKITECHNISLRIMFRECPENALFRLKTF